MEKILMLIAAVLLVVLWSGFLLPQYVAYKNKRYRAIIVSLLVFAVSVAAFIGMIWYGDLLNAMFYGKENSRTDEVNELVLALLGMVWGFGHCFCWWYIYARKSTDYVYIEDCTADEIDKTISPEWKKLLGLQ